MQIRKLNEETINQIAAGEVIEGPFSCVKELLDNAIDSKATHIIIKISLGGQESIQIQDNGKGIPPDELTLAVERHATSKIQSTFDLDALTTMGFRGEALSSIASVSQLSILSAERTDDEIQVHTNIGQGAKITLHGGKQISFETGIQTSFGTSVEVNRLFYNTPARRKFMKSPKEDARLIYKTVLQTALANPEISFEFLVDGALKARFTKEGENTKEKLQHRIKEVMGSEVVAEGIFIEESLSNGLLLQGFIGFPHTSKSSRSSQYLIVNGRPIHSLTISYAVKNGYATSIGKDEHPIYALFLTIPTEEIDINVHPQKKEIRFRNEELLKSDIERIIASCLFMQSEEVAAPSYKENIERAIDLAPMASLSTSIEPMHRSLPSHSFSFNKPPSLFQAPEISIPLQKTAPRNIEQPLDEIKNSYTFTLCPPPNSTFCAVVLITSRSPLIINLQAACKALYILQNIEQNKREKTAVERLLIPHIIRIEKAQLSYFEEHIAEFEEEGFIIRPFGPDSFMIEALPKGILLGKIDLDSFFTTYIDRKEEREEELYDKIPEKVVFNGVEYPKELLSRAFQKASRIVRSLRAFQKGQEIPIEFASAIIKEWIRRGLMPVSLSGERILVDIDEPFLRTLFS